MLENSTWVTLMPILSLLYYLVPIVFIVWFVTKFLKIQKEKNEILRTISEKIDKLKD